MRPHPFNTKSCPEGSDPTSDECSGQNRLCDARLIQQVTDARTRLVRALQRGQSHQACLSLWSNFVRTRDGNCCVQCECKRDLAAHHIFRKSFLPNAQFEPGNGITLCRKCHKGVHRGFNGRADMHLPMDAQGGEKADDVSTMLGHLVIKSRQYPSLVDAWYYLSESTLATISLLQGFDAATRLDVSRIEQAYIVWNQAPGTVRDAILQANGLKPFQGPLLPGIHIAYDECP